MTLRGGPLAARAGFGLAWRTEALMYVITGGAGFIGSALLWQLNRMDLDEIVVVDNLASSEKWRNLVKRRYVDYLHRDRFYELMRRDALPWKITAVVHLGACSSTTERDADFLMENNFHYSRDLCRYALDKGARFINASSAATYGDGSLGFSDDPALIPRLAPLNMYGYSKQLFDLWLLREKLHGEVVSLNVSAGIRVSAGQVLATLGGSSAQTSLENASISLQNAQLSLQNAQDALDNYTITAPISGTVIEKNFKAGDTIDNNSLTAAGGTLAVLYDMSTLTFEMKIDEKDINKVQVGQEVTITADAVEGVTFSGVVDTVNINGTTVSGQTNYPVTVVINDPQDLKPGMNVSADIIVERAGTVLCVPVDAVNRGSDKPTVQVAQEGALDENGNVVDPSKLETREVTLGRNDNDNIEITSGLSEGEIVVWVNEVSNPFAAMMGM